MNVGIDLNVDSVKYCIFVSELSEILIDFTFLNFI